MEENVRASDVTISNSEIAMLLGQKLPEENKQAGDKDKKESAREAFVRKIRVPSENNKNKKITGKVLTREEIDFLLGNSKTEKNNGENRKKGKSQSDDREH